MQQGELVIYKTENNTYFQIKHIYQSKELDSAATVRKFRTVQAEGKRKDVRNIDHYNLDMIGL